MADYGHPIEFGYFLTPDASDPGGVLETARLADELGYDLLGVQDHPYQRRHLDALALIGVILGQTERIRVFPAVGNLPLRPPAVFAKAAATLDVLSGGRFEAGLGGGGYLEPAHAMGAPELTPGESIEALEEAVEILRESWNGARSIRHHGRHYDLEGMKPGPAPAHPIGIWLGAAKPRALALTGRAADGWVAPMMVYVPPAEVPAAEELIDRAARDAGRDPGEIRRIYIVSGEFTAEVPGPGAGDRSDHRRPPRPLGRRAHPFRARPRVRHAGPGHAARSRHAADLHRGGRAAGARAGRGRPPMTSLEAMPETFRGRATYEMLLSVHAKIRRDLERVELLAERALQGLPAEEIRREVNELRRDSMLWRLQVDCLHYCRFVHMHHGAEDHQFFPELRETNPALNPVIDRLEGDHRRVSDDLDAVEAAARNLTDDESEDARQAVVESLRGLGENLLEHLDYEELSLKSTVLRLGVGSSP